MSATAIILARAGSRGVPGKNVAPVADRPCIAWTIDDANAANEVSRVCVSSDDERALEVARSMGVETVERPNQLADDGATIDDAARHAYDKLGSPDGPVVILYANVPVRPAGLIDRAIEMMGHTNADSVQSYAPVGKHHPWWTVRVDMMSGDVRPWEGGVLNHGVYRRQDLPAAYGPDGGVIVVSADALMRRVGAPDGPHGFLGNNRRGVLTGEGEVVDIDSRIDLLVADAVLRERVAKLNALKAG
ncbi:MAG: acylneuraminate cytidylyltransferase family protein [Phycisphaerales bacterium]